MQLHIPSATGARAFDALDGPRRAQLLALAATLERAASQGQPLQSLRGKNIAVLCEEENCPGLVSLQQAATALGANVAHIRPSEALSGHPQRPEAVGELLGRLYDAIDCHGLDTAVVAQLRQTSGKPVFEELVGHSACEGTVPPPSGFVLQAVLLEALG